MFVGSGEHRPENEHADDSENSPSMTDAGAIAFLILAMLDLIGIGSRSFWTIG
jgi:hypothetical protein